MNDLQANAINMCIEITVKQSSPVETNTFEHKTGESNQNICYYCFKTQPYHNTFQQICTDSA